MDSSRRLLSNYMNGERGSWGKRELCLLQRGIKDCLDTLNSAPFQPYPNTKPGGRGLR